MNGIKALRQVLIADAALTALVPAARIVAGILPQGTALPAISLTSVSGNDRNIPSPGATRFVTQRIQASILAADYPATRTIIAAVRDAAADRRPTVAGLTAVTIHTEGMGPDMMDEAASIYQASQDFAVRYNEGT